MVNLSKAVKNSGKVAKVAGVSALALVLAHPTALAFSISAIVGVGITVYYLKHSNKIKKEGNLKYSFDGAIPHPENAKLVTDFPSSNASSSNDMLKKSKVSQSASSTSKKYPGTSDGEKNSLTVSKDAYIENSGNNLKTPNDLDKSEKENVYKDVHRSTSEIDLRGSNDKPAQCCNTYCSHSLNTSEVNSSNVTDLISLNSSKISSEASDEKINKEFSKKVCTKTNVHDDDNLNIGMYEEDNVCTDNFWNTSEANSRKNSYNLSQCFNIYEFRSVNNLDENSSNISGLNISTEEVTGIRNLSSVDTLLSEESDWCRACEENLANTRTQPCNHRYMCGNCAVKIVRLFKRCKFCGAKIKEISLEVS